MELASTAREQADVERLLLWFALHGDDGDTVRGCVSYGMAPPRAVDVARVELVEGRVGGPHSFS